MSVSLHKQYCITIRTDQREKLLLFLMQAQSHSESLVSHPHAAKKQEVNHAKLAQSARMLWVKIPRRRRTRKHSTRGVDLE